MNVGIETEATQFLLWEYINWTFGAVRAHYMVLCCPHYTLCVRIFVLLTHRSPGDGAQSAYNPRPGSARHSLQGTRVRVSWKLATDER